MIAIIKRLSVVMLLLALVIVAGTLGFMSLEGLSAFDAFYLTVVTITTVGYGDIVAVTPAGRLLAMALIVTGFTVFTSVVVTSIRLMFEQREESRRSQQIHTLTNLFFSKVGDKLIRLLWQCDPGAGCVMTFAPGQTLKPADFVSLAEKLKQHPCSIDPRRLDSAALKKLLDSPLLLNLLENPSVFGHAPFNSLLRAAFHIRDELAAHPGFPDLPEGVLAHLVSDMGKVYQPMVRLWVEHMNYLRIAYPSLFYTLLIENPFGCRAVKEKETASTQPGGD